MKFFKPIVQLIRRKNMDEPDQYSIHVVTFCDKSNYRAQGNNPISFELDENNLIYVDLTIGTEMDLPNFEAITPVVHTLELGNMPFDHENFGIKVNVFVSGRNGDPPAGSSTVSPADADGDSRPIGGN